MLAAGGFWGSNIQFCQPADRSAHLPPCRAGRAGPGSFVSCRTAPHYLRFWPLDCFAGMCGHATTFAWVPSKTSLDVCRNTGCEGLLCRDLLCPPVTVLGVLSEKGRCTGSNANRLAENKHATAWCCPCGLMIFMMAKLRRRMHVLCHHSQGSHSLAAMQAGHALYPHMLPSSWKQMPGIIDHKCMRPVKP